MRMIGKTNRFPCCDFCDANRSPKWRKPAVRTFKRREKQQLQKEIRQGVI